MKRLGFPVSLPQGKKPRFLWIETTCSNSCKANRNLLIITRRVSQGHRDAGAQDQVPSWMGRRLLLGLAAGKRNTFHGCKALHKGHWASGSRQRSGQPLATPQASRKAEPPRREFKGNSPGCCRILSWERSGTQLACIARGCNSQQVSETGLHQSFGENQFLGPKNQHSANRELTWGSKPELPVQGNTRRLKKFLGKQNQKRSLFWCKIKK